MLHRFTVIVGILFAMGDLPPFLHADASFSDFPGQRWEVGDCWQIQVDQFSRDWQNQLAVQRGFPDGR